jgi:hypothetical protein
MATRRERGGLPEMGMFYCGMGVIIAATLLNIAHDRLPERGVDSLPPFLANMYDMSGKLGVTLTLVTAGMSIILLGFVVQRNRRAQRAAGRVSPTASTPYFYTSSGDEPESGVTSGGTVVLQTSKYLAPAAALSGTTGFPAPRQPSQ